MAVTWTTQQSYNGTSVLDWDTPSDQAASPWYDGGAQSALARYPGSGGNANADLVIIANGHNLYADSAIRVGDPATPASLAISNAAGGTGTLTVGPNGAVTVVSNVLHRGSAVWTFGAGADLVFDSSTVLTWTVSETGYNAKLVFAGISGNRCSISNAGAANARFAAATGSSTSANFDISHTDITGLGDASNNALTHYGNSSSARLNLHHVDFYGCGRTEVTYTHAASYINLDTVTWYSTVATRSFVPTAVQPLSGGTRRIYNCYFDKVFGNSSTLTDYSITWNGFEADISNLNSVANPWAEFYGNFWVSSNGSRTLNGQMLATNPSNYIHFHSTGGPINNLHGLSHSPYLTGNVEFGGLVIEPGNTDTAGDLFITNTMTGATTLTIRNNLVLPNASGVKCGELVSCLAPQTNLTLVVEHNTVVSDGVGETGVIHFGETYKGKAGMISSCQSNLCWSYASGQLLQGTATGTPGTTVAVTNGSPTVTGTATKWSTGLDTGATQTALIAGDYIRIGTDTTAYLVQSVDSDTSITLATNYAGSTAGGLSWTPLVKNVVTTCGRNGKWNMGSGTDGAGYNSAFPWFTAFTSPPGTGDVTLSGDPFVDKTRGIATFAVSKGLALVGDTYNAKILAVYAYIKGSPAARIAEFLAWLKAGWQVTAASLYNAGHDGVTMGAMPYVAEAVVPAPSHIHTWFNEPIAFRSGASTYFGIYADTGVLGVGKYDHARQVYEVGNPRGVNGAPIELDDHNNPAVLVLHNGKVLAAYAEHPGKSWASVSNNAHDVRGGFVETQLSDGSTHYSSYAHLAQTTDDLNTIWLFFREGQNVGVGGGMPIAFRINQAGGDGGSWTSSAGVVKLIKNLVVTGQRPYFRLTWSGRRVDIVYTSGHPDEIQGSLWHVYVEINQAGTQFSVRKSDDTLIDTWALAGGAGIVNGKTLPLDVAEGTKIYDGATNQAWIWDVRWVAGTLQAVYPVFSQTTLSRDTHRYRRCTLSGGTWTNEDICYAGDSLTPASAGRTPHWIYPDGSTAQPCYSPGICLDPNVPDRVYLGKKYGEGDVRMQQWDKSGGVWSKTSDLSGASGNGLVNARPFSVVGASPTQVLWWKGTYTSYINYATRVPTLLTPLTLARRTKPASPIWTPSRAPVGTRAFYLIREGSGLVVADLTGNYNGAISGGTLSRGVDELGNYLAGFSNTVAVVADSLAASGFFDSANYPRWMVVLYKSLTSATGQYLAGFGAAAGTNPMFGAVVNNTTDNQVGGIVRDNAGANNQGHVTKTRDAGYHTLFILAESASAFRVYSDGQHVVAGTNALSTVNYDKFTLGALRRQAAQSNGASGCIISAAVVGSGDAPSPIHMHCDLVSGQFLGTWDVPTIASAAPLLILSAGRAA